MNENINIGEELIKFFNDKNDTDKLNKIEVEQKIVKKVDLFYKLINNDIIKNYYIQDLQNWDAICASLRILSDLQVPKNEYYALKEINYLQTIGIIQTIYIEQDTINTLYYSLKLIEEKNQKSEEKKDEEKFNSGYNDIRYLRNKIFGHPSDNSKNPGGIITRHFFKIYNKNTQEIIHTTWGAEKEIEFNITENQIQRCDEDKNLEDNKKRIFISELVNKNSEITYKYSINIENKFKEKLSKIMENYKINFQEIKKKSNNYFSKLTEKENYYYTDLEYDRVSKDDINNLITEINEGLNERNLFNEDKYKLEFNVIKFFSSKLIPLMGEKNHNDIEFYSYASTLYQKIRDLIQNILDEQKNIEEFVNKNN